MPTRSSAACGPVSGKLNRAKSRTLEEQVRALQSASASLRDSLKIGAAPAEIATRAKVLMRELNGVTNLRDALDELVESAEKEAESEFLRLEAQLRAACVARGWTFHGSWPHFFVERSIGVELDEKARSAIVAGRQTSATVNTLLETLTPLVKQLLPKSFNPERFLHDLANAFDVVSKPGAQAPILEVYRQLVINSQSSRFWKDARGEGFIPLSIEQFRARFSGTLGSANKLSDGRSLRLVPPLDARDGIFIWQPAENRFGYVGRIQFVQDSSRS
jgi:hypothetical protein